MKNEVEQTNNEDSNDEVVIKKEKHQKENYRNTYQKTEEKTKRCHGLYKS